MRMAFFRKTGMRIRLQLEIDEHLEAKLLITVAPSGFFEEGKTT